MKYNANQKVLHLLSKNDKKMDIIFNVSDDGFTFKYKFPEKSEDIKYITEEKTAYNFKTYTKSWLQPISKAKTGWEGTNPSYEEYYQMDIALGTVSLSGEGWVYPALFKTHNTWMVISETGLCNTSCVLVLEIT